MNNRIRWEHIIWISLFVLSRVYILFNPPVTIAKPELNIPGSGYSDVKQDYERYANMWHYGLTPYLKHWYEYPPIAIPFTYIPLWIDLHGIGHYYQNYRVHIFFWEFIFFISLLATVHASPLKSKNKRFALLFYIVLGMIAKDFWYDGLDLVFIMSFAGALIWRYFIGHNTWWKRIGFWMMFWISAGIKLLTLPLFLPLILAHGIAKIRREVFSSIMAFIIVFAVPLGLYRSSLSVFLVFHGERPLKYEAFGSFIIRTINDFTGTETQSDIKPHFPMIGPVSSAMERITSITFPLSLIAVLLYFSYRFIKQPITNNPQHPAISSLLLMSLTYIFILFISSKILSRPFHIWYIPLLALYPFARTKQQLTAMLLATIMVVLDTTPWIKAPAGNIGGILAFDRVRDVFRFAPMFMLLWLMPTWKTRA